MHLMIKSYGKIFQNCKQLVKNIETVFVWAFLWFIRPTVWVRLGPNLTFDAQYKIAILTRLN